MTTTWKDWFATNRSNIGPSWLQSVNYMSPVYSHIYSLSPPPSTLLEIGCGMGDSARALSIMGYQVTALDNNEEILHAAAYGHIVNNGNIKFLLGDALHPPVGFDIATSFGIIEHVPTTERIRMLTTMKQSAKLVAVTIPSPYLCKLSDRAMGEHDITFKQLLHECYLAGWKILMSFGWGNPPQLDTIHDSLPPAIWRRLQYRGKCSLSFCVIGK